MTENKEVDVNQIMKEIEYEVNKKMMNKEFAQDVERVRRMTTVGSKFSKDFDKYFNDLYALSYIKKRITLPQSTKKGFVAGFINKFILKIYYIITKMIGPVLDTQERLNKEVVKEITDIKKTLNMDTAKLENFPYDDYYEKYFPEDRFNDEELTEYDELFRDKRTVLIVGINIGKVVKRAEASNAKYIIALDLAMDEQNIVEGGRVITQRMEIIEFFKSKNNEEVDSIIILDVLNHYSLDHVISIIGEIKRILIPYGDIIIRNTKSLYQVSETYDPKAKQDLPKDLFKFLFEYFSFNIFKLEDCKLHNNSSKYVIAAKKA